MTNSRSRCMLLILTMLVGCTSFQPLYPASDIIVSPLEAGDFVRVATRKGDLLECRVEITTEEGFACAGQTLDPEEIAQMEVRRWDAGETLWLLGGIAVGVVVLWTASIAACGIACAD